MILDLAELQRESDQIKKMGDAIETAFKNARAGSEKELAKMSEAIEKVVKNTEKEMKKTEPTLQGVGKSILAVTGSVESGLKTIAGSIPQIATAMENSSFNSVAETISQGLGGIAGQLKEAAGEDNGILTGLSSIASMGGKIASIAGIVVSVGETIYNAIEANKQALAQAELESRFGDIELSIREVEAAAKAVTTTKWTMQLDAVISASEKTEQLKQDVQTAMDTLKAENFHIELGVKLSEDEQTNYRDSVSGYVSSVQGYMDQQHYTASLAVNAIMTPGTEGYANLSAFVDDFYSNSKTELDSLGQDMAKVVDDALADGMITEDEKLNIQNTLNKLQNYINKVEQAKSTAKIKSITRDTLSGEITADSLKNFNDQALKELDSQLQKSEDAYQITLGEIELGFQEGRINESSYNALIAYAEEGLNQKQATLTLATVGIAVDKVESKFGAELTSWKTDVQTTFQKLKDYYSVNLSGDFLGFFGGFENKVWEMNQELDENTKRAVDLMVQNLQPDKVKLEEIAESYRRLGMAPPENIMAALNDINTLEQLSGSTENLYKTMAYDIAHSSEQQAMMIEIVKKGEEIPEELADSLLNDYGLELINENGKFMWSQVRDIALSESESLAGLFTQVGWDMPQAMIDSLQGQDASVIQQSAMLFSNLKENVELSKEELTALMQGVGIETTDGLLTSLTEKEPEVQMKAIELLGQLKYGTDAEKLNVLEQLYSMGIQVPDSLAQGIKNNYGVVQESSEGAIYLVNRVTGEKIKEITPEFAAHMKNLGVKGIEKMDDYVTGVTVGPPKVGIPDVESAIQAIRNKLNTADLTVDVKIGYGWQMSGLIALQAIRGKASGGIVESPEIALIGEAGPESIIPLSRSRRSRALELYTQTSEALGVDEQITRAAVMSSVSGSRAAMAFLAAEAVTPESRVEINYRKLAQELYGALSASPIEVKPSFTVTGGDVYLDTMKAGKALAPHIDAELGKINHRRERGL